MTEYKLPVTVVSILAASALTALAAPPPAVTELREPARLSFRINVPHQGAALTVSGPDTLIEREYPGDVVFEPYTADGGILPDGVYAYELQLLPPRDPSLTQEDLRGLRELHDRGTPEERTRIESHLAPLQETRLSGSFSIRDGSIVVDPATEGAAPTAPAGDRDRRDLGPVGGQQDFTVAEDLYVQGSLCLGVDCPASGLAFSFDTQILRENNLRILFDDTSTSAGFPSRDWRLIANDSASGGASYFSIEDATAGRRAFTIEAGAPSNALYVEDGGRLGIRTSTPILDVHARNGNTPGLRLEQDGSSGFTPQAWDVAGNEANFFVRDVTGGSRLPLRIRPGARTSSIDISSAGNVGIGFASPTTRLEIQANEALRLGSTLLSSGGPYAHLSNSTWFNGTTWQANIDPSRGGALVQLANDNISFYKVSSGSEPIFTTIMTLGGANPLQMQNGAFVTPGGVWTDASSRELKQDIAPLTAEDALEALADLTPVRFSYKADGQEKHVGFIAEDVPELVAASGRKGVATMDIVGVLTRVIQEQQRQIDELTKRLERLEP